jgi:hypothetical protein
MSTARSRQEKNVNYSALKYRRQCIAVIRTAKGGLTMPYKLTYVDFTDSFLFP